MIEFSCPVCKQSYRAQDEAAGQKGNCPKCHQRLQVPDKPAVPRNKTILGTINEPSATTPPAASEFSPWQTLDDPPARNDLPAKDDDMVDESVIVTVVDQFPVPVERARLIRKYDDEDDDDEVVLSPCPFCRKRIDRLARKCKYCGEVLDDLGRRARFDTEGFRCPFCKYRVEPETRTVISRNGWLVLCVLLFTFPCLFWIGLCITETKHYCPDCGLDFD